MIRKSSLPGKQLPFQYRRNRTTARSEDPGGRVALKGTKERIGRQGFGVISIRIPRLRRIEFPFSAAPSSPCNRPRQQESSRY